MYGAQWYAFNEAVHIVSYAMLCELQEAGENCIMKTIIVRTPNK
jgi:hypothetical protein